MTNETATPQKKALLEAFDTVLKTQAEEREAQRRAEEARRRAQNRTRPLLWICALVTLCVSAYLWIEQPDWLYPGRTLPESAAVKEASLRIAMANVAQHVERYRQRHGRLPVTLAEAGTYGEGYIFQHNGSDWRLMGQNGEVRLTLTSSEQLTRFVGSSFDVVARRGQ